MPVLEVIIQTLFAFSGVFLFARILGKQLVAQLSVFEYISGITFGSIAGNMAADIQQGATAYHFIGLTVFFLLTYTMDRVVLVSRPARKLMVGEPTVVIHKGKVLENNMRTMNYTLDELMMQLRDKGYFDLTKVEYAILEINGSLSVLPKSSFRPVTPEDLNITAPQEGVMSEIIVDGQIIYQNLVQNNLDDGWLLEELEKQGIKDLQEVAFAGLSSDGILHVDKVKDPLGSSPLNPTDLPKVRNYSGGKNN